MATVPNFDPAFGIAPRLLGGSGDMGAIAFSCISARTRRMQSVKIKYLTDKLDEATPDRRILDLFDMPNSIMTGPDLFALMEGYRLTSGGYVLVKRANGLPVLNGRQIPDELLIYPLTSFQPRYTGNIADPYKLEGYNFCSPGGTIKWFALDQLVVYRDPDYSGMFRAMPALKHVLSASAMYANVDKYMNAILVNNARPGSIWTAKAGIHDDERAKLHAEIRGMYGGPENAGKPAVLSGEWQIDTLPLVAPKDVVSQDLWVQTVQRVAMVFSVPPIELGVNDNVNRASASVMKAAFMTSTIMPMLETHGRALKRGLFRALGVPYFLDFDAMSLPEYTDVISTRIDNVERMISTGTPRNEAYRRMNIPVDDQKFGDVPLLKTGMQRADDVAAKPAPIEAAPAPAVKPPAPVAGPEDDTPEKAAPIIVRTLPMSERIKALSVKKRRALALEIQEQCAMPFEPQLTAATAKWVKRWKGHFSKRLEWFFEHGTRMDEGSDMAKDLSVFFVAKSGTRTPSESDFESFFPPEADAQADLKTAWRATFGEVEAAVVGQMATQCGSVDLWLAKPPEDRRGVALDRLGDAIKVDETIRRQLKAVLADQLSQPVMPSPVKVAEALRAEAKHVFDGAIARTNTIGRTEIGGVLSDYRAAIKAAEKRTTKSWSSAGDACVRATHRICEAEGEIPIGQAFSNGLQRPHDPSGTAGEVCNCRCTEI